MRRSKNNEWKSLKRIKLWTAEQCQQTRSTWYELDFFFDTSFRISTLFGRNNDQRIEKPKNVIDMKWLWIFYECGMSSIVFICAIVYCLYRPWHQHLVMPSFTISAIYRHFLLIFKRFLNGLFCPSRSPSLESSHFHIFDLAILIECIMAICMFLLLVRRVFFTSGM